MKYDPLIIAFTAPKQTGKTTVCRSISVQHLCSTVSFAGPLKGFAQQFFDREYMNEKKEEVQPNIGVSYRDWAVATGDAWRSLNKDIFLNLAGKECEEVALFMDPEATILIDDLRYDNEGKWVKDQGGIIIRLCRDGIHYKMDHATEQPINESLVDFECHVDNVVELVSRLIDERNCAEVEK